MHSAIGSFGHSDCFSVYFSFIIFHVTVITTNHVTVVFSRASTTTMPVTVASTSMELAVSLGQHNLVLLPPLILRDEIRGVLGLASMPQQQPQSHMPSQAYGNYVMVLVR